LPRSQIRRTDDSVRGLSGEFGTGTNYRACSGTDDLEVNGRRTDDSVQGLLTSSVQNRNAQNKEIGETRKVVEGLTTVSAQQAQCSIWRGTPSRIMANDADIDKGEPGLDEPNVDGGRQT
jgi:hypothetical protein